MLNAAIGLVKGARPPYMAVEMTRLSGSVSEKGGPVTSQNLTTELMS